MSGRKSNNVQHYNVKKQNNKYNLISEWNELHLFFNLFIFATPPWVADEVFHPF